MRGAARNVGNGNGGAGIVLSQFEAKITTHSSQSYHGNFSRIHQLVLIGEVTEASHNWCAASQSASPGIRFYRV